MKRLWAWLKSALGFGAQTAASAPLGGIPGAISATGEAVKAGADLIREGNRNATEREIAKQHRETDAKIDEAIRKATPNGAALALALALAGFSLVGCASAPERGYAASSGNVGRLLARPDFEAAAKASPEWVRDALKTVNSLEADVQRERARANQVR